MASMPITVHSGHWAPQLSLPVCHKTNSHAAQGAAGIESIMRVLSNRGRPKDAPTASRKVCHESVGGRSDDYIYDTP